MTLVYVVNKSLATLTLIGGIALVLFLGALITKGITRNWPLLSLGKKIRKQGLLIAFIIAVIATSGSLFYSEVAGWDPCKLCWYQRIFMYPLTLLLGIALVKKDTGVRKYVLGMGLVGIPIAIYHYAIQRLSYAASCSADGLSCSSKYTFQYGYITIPMMALTAFVMIVVLMVYLKKKESY